MLSSARLVYLRGKRGEEGKGGLSRHRGAAALWPQASIHPLGRCQASPVACRFYAARTRCGTRLLRATSGRAPESMSWQAGPNRTTATSGTHDRRPLAIAVPAPPPPPPTPTPMPDRPFGPQLQRLLDSGCATVRRDVASFHSLYTLCQTAPTIDDFS